VHAHVHKANESEADKISNIVNGLEVSLSRAETETRSTARCAQNGDMQPRTTGKMTGSERRL
jgi:hypothetical protein